MSVLSRSLVVCNEDCFSLMCRCWNCLIFDMAMMMILLIIFIAVILFLEDVWNVRWIRIVEFQCFVESKVLVDVIWLVGILDCVYFVWEI